MSIAATSRPQGRPRGGLPIFSPSTRQNYTTVLFYSTWGGPHRDAQQLRGCPRIGMEAASGRGAYTQRTKYIYKHIYIYVHHMYNYRKERQQRRQPSGQTAAPVGHRAATRRSARAAATALGRHGLARWPGMCGIAVRGSHHGGPGAESTVSGLDPQSRCRRVHRPRGIATARRAAVRSWRLDAATPPNRLTDESMKRTPASLEADTGWCYAA